MESAENKVIRTERKIASKTVYSHLRKRTYQVGYDALVVSINKIVLTTINLEEARCNLRNLPKNQTIETIVNKLDHSMYDWLKPGRREEAKEAVRTALENIL